MNRLLLTAAVALAASLATPHAWAQASRDAEPSLASLRHAALRFADLERAPEIEWTRRSRIAALLPDLSLRVDRALARDADLSRASSGTQRIDLGTDEDTALQARAVWRLDRLLFDDVELRIYQVARQRQHQRTELLLQVTRMYYQRQRLLLGHTGGNRKQSSAERALAIEELTDQLDALTGGYYRRALSESRVGFANAVARPVPTERQLRESEGSQPRKTEREVTGEVPPN